VAEEKLLTPEDVAERLQVSRWTVMDYLREGRIQGRKVGRLWRITEGDLQAFIEGLSAERPASHPEPAAQEGL
jgi:excisionase family DNA binding protein